MDIINLKGDRILLEKGIAYQAKDVLFKTLSEMLEGVFVFKLICRKLTFTTVLLLLILVQVKVHAFQITDNQTVDANKTWIIRFTDTVGFDDLTKSAIVVTDSKGSAVKVTTSEGNDSKSILVNAPQGGYTPGESYILNIYIKAHSNKGKNLKQIRSIHFNIDTNDKNNSSEWASIVQGEPYPNMLTDPTTKKQVKVTWTNTVDINTAFVDADNINDCRVSKVTLEGVASTGTKIKATIGIIPKIMGITTDTNSTIIYTSNQQAIVINVDRNTNNGVIDLKELSAHLKAVILEPGGVTKKFKTVNVLQWSQLYINPSNSNSYFAKVIIEHYNNDNPSNAIINIK